MKNLFKFWANENKIEKLPNSFFNLKKLVYIDLKINYLEKFPEKIYKLKNLEILDMRHNFNKKNPKKVKCKLLIDETLIFYYPYRARYYKNKRC